MQGPSLTQTLLLILWRFAEFCSWSLTSISFVAVHSLPSLQRKQPKGVSTANAIININERKTGKLRLQYNKFWKMKKYWELETKVLSSLMWNTMNSIGLLSISPKKELTNWSRSYRLSPARLGRWSAWYRRWVESARFDQSNSGPYQHVQLVTRELRSRQSQALFWGCTAKEKRARDTSSIKRKSH